MGVWVPYRMELGKPASIYVQVQPEGASAIGEAIPPVRLLSIRHTVKARTWFRVPFKNWDLAKNTSEKELLWSQNSRN